MKEMIKSIVKEAVLEALLEFTSAPMVATLDGEDGSSGSSTPSDEGLKENTGEGEGSQVEENGGDSDNNDNNGGGPIRPRPMFGTGGF